MMVYGSYAPEMMDKPKPWTYAEIRLATSADGFNWIVNPTWILSYLCRLDTGQTAKGFWPCQTDISPQGHGLSFGTLLFQGKSAYNDNDVVRMKRLTFLIALVVPVVTLAGPSASVVSDTTIIESAIPDNGITTGQTEAGNSSAGATTTITTYAVA